jgi:hypothetical protein
LVLFAIPEGQSAGTARIEFPRAARHAVVGG